jgi:hypothetical protein
MKGASDRVHVMRSDEVQVTGNGRERAAADDQKGLESICHDGKRNEGCLNRS